MEHDQPLCVTASSTQRACCLDVRKNVDEEGRATGPCDDILSNWGPPDGSSV